ncbi:hypothetical protein RB195_000499 [Necator americanus]|uniref:Uncharacterized protein n=1 Tax=Necator americanus TaxID=51031 RepID=A0ABR1DA21_NECAM
MCPSFRCFYQPLLKNSNGFELGNIFPIEFNQPTAIIYDQIAVKCERNSPQPEIFYSKALVNVPISSASTTRFVRSDPDFPSLAMLIFDSVSLNHFKRSLPKTTQFLADNGFLTFNLYGQESDDSDANVLSILRGGASNSDNQIFLWDVMKDRGCTTFVSEELGGSSSILSNISINVDHDLRPFHEFSHSRTKGFCTQDGRVASLEYLENWWKILLNMKDVCQFSMHVVRTVTNSDYLTVVDNVLRSSLDILKGNGFFDKAVFVLLSGGGNPRVPSTNLYTAKVEERSPLFSIKFPEKFRKKYFMEYYNIDYNIDRLVNTKDIGSTLMDIAAMSNFSIDIRGYSGGGMSLLRHTIDQYRSCEQANIPQHLCICMDHKDIESQKYDRNSVEFNNLFHYVEKEALKHKCMEEAFVTQRFDTLSVFSLNRMVEEGVRNEDDWTHVRNSSYDIGMRYFDIIVGVKTFQREQDVKQIRLHVLMRFRHTERFGTQPVGSPMVIWVNQRCGSRSLDQFCHMCYDNKLLTED